MFQLLLNIQYLSWSLSSSKPLIKCVKQVRKIIMYKMTLQIFFQTFCFQEQIRIQVQIILFFFNLVVLHLCDIFIHTSILFQSGLILEAILSNCVIFPLLPLKNSVTPILPTKYKIKFNIFLSFSLHLTFHTGKLSHTFAFTHRHKSTL